MFTRNRTSRAVLTAFVLASAVASHAATFDVNIQNFAFSPSSLTINVGDSVRWTNNDFAPHTATSTSGPVSFDTGTLTNGQSAIVSFAQAGTYHYQCDFHPHMMGTIQVVPEPATLAALAIGAAALRLRRKSLA